MIAIIIPFALFVGGLWLLGEAASNAQGLMGISSVIPYVLGGIGCWVLLVIYIYLLVSPDISKTKNRKKLLDELCEFARSDNYIYAYVDLSRDPYACSSLCFKTADGNSANYYFNQHGYAAIRVERIFDVFDALGDRLNGYVIRDYNEFLKSGFYSDDPDNVYLLLGEAAAVERKKREVYENSNMNHKKLKQI